MMEIECLDPQTDPRWQQLLERRPSSAFHSPSWIRVLSDTYGFDVRAYIAMDTAGEPVAGLPFCRLEDVRGERIVALPFSDYCDPLVGDGEQWQALSDELLRSQAPVRLRCLHSEIPLTDERLTLANHAKWHGLDLGPDVDTLWGNLHGSARRAIKKARQSGVSVRVAEHKDELRAFFELHLGLRKYKYRLLAQPYQFFENIWQQFMEKDQGFLLTARHEDTLIGGILFLEWQGGLYYKFNASSPEALVVRPNDLLIWEGIQHGKAKGYTHLDFGLSDWDQEQLVRYKRKFASEEKTISFLSYQPETEAKHSEQQAGSLLPQLTALFTQDAVPDQLTERAGEVLYRFFC